MAAINTIEVLKLLKEYGADTTGAVARFVGDEQLFCNCVLSFFNDENLKQLMNALERLDYEDAFFAAHTLKGLTGNLGLNPLYDRVSYLTELLRDEKYDEIAVEQEAVLLQYNRLKTILADSAG